MKKTFTITIDSDLCYEVYTQNNRLVVKEQEDELKHMLLKLDEDGLRAISCIVTEYMNDSSDQDPCVIWPMEKFDRIMKAELGEQGTLSDLVVYARQSPHFDTDDGWFKFIYHGCFDDYWISMESIKSIDSIEKLVDVDKFIKWLHENLRYDSTLGDVREYLEQQTD